MSPTVRKQVSTTQTPANIHEVLRWRVSFFRPVGIFQIPPQHFAGRFEFAAGIEIGAGHLPGRKTAQRVGVLAGAHIGFA